MIIRSLLSAAVLLMVSVPSNAGELPGVDFMQGRWAVDCNKEATLDNPYQLWTKTTEGHLQRQTDPQDYIVEIVSAEWKGEGMTSVLVLTGTASNQDKTASAPLIITYMVEPLGVGGVFSRIRIWDAYSNEFVIVKNGVRQHQDHQETKWFNQCSRG